MQEEKHIQPGPCSFGATKEETLAAWGLDESAFEYEEDHMFLTNRVPFEDKKARAYVWYVPTSLYAVDFMFSEFTQKAAEAFCGSMEKCLSKYDWLDYGPKVKSIFEERGTEPDYTVEEYFTERLNRVQKGDENVILECGDQEGTYMIIHWMKQRNTDDGSLSVKVSYE